MKLKDFVSYPGHGLGQVTELKSMHGTEFYSIIIMDSGLKILVPTTSQDLVRPLMDLKTARLCNKYLKDPSEYMPDNKVRNMTKRWRLLLAKLKSNNPIHIAEVYAELCCKVLDGEELSFGERKMRESALALIEPEIGLVLNEKAV